LSMCPTLRKPTAVVAFMAMVVAAVAAPYSGCAAQTSVAPSSVSGTLQEFTSGELVRLSLLELRTIEKPGPGDYAVTGALLSLAEGLSPNDAEIVRRRVEALWNAGDDDGVLVATERLVRLDPQDHVAQLRLITAKIGRLQTAEERLRTYDAFLGAKGQVFDASIRSRIALDSAMLLRERRDEEGFIKRLTLATQLDGTNKDAALLALRVASERGAPPISRLELLANLLYADPMDPNVHLEICDELVAVGAYKSANRFHNIALKILAAAGREEDPQRLVESVVLDWHTGGPRAALDYVSTQLANERSRVERARESRADTFEIQRPEDVRLGLPFEEIRAAAALTLPDLSTLSNSLSLERSLTEMALTVQLQMTGLTDRNLRPADVSEEDAKARADELFRRLQLWRLLTNIGTDEAVAAMEQALAGLPPQDPTRVALEAWGALRAGDAAKALAIVAAAPGTNIWGLLAQAAALEQTGDKAGAIATYTRAAELDPLNPLGVMALDRATRASGAGPLSGSKLAREATDYAATIPDWIDTMVDLPRKFQMIRVEHEVERAKTLQRVNVRVVLKNLAPIPLGLGSDRSMSTQLLFGPSMDVGVHGMGDTIEEVVELDRRLRLMPGEELHATVWPESGLVGWISQLGCASTSRLRWRVLQGFQIGREGPKRPGPGCLQATTGSLLRDPLDEGRLLFATLSERIREATESQLPGVLVATRAALVSFSGSGSLEGAKPLTDALIERFPTWSPLGRMVALAILPPPAQLTSLQGFDDMVVQHLTAPAVEGAAEVDPGNALLLVVAVTRTTDPESPLLAAAVASSDSRLAAAARIHKERLAAGVSTFAKVGVQIK